LESQKVFAHFIDGGETQPFQVTASSGEFILDLRKAITEECRDFLKEFGVSKVSLWKVRCF